MLFEESGSGRVNSKLIGEVVVAERRRRDRASSIRCGCN
jgi:hypothetical protein